MTTKKIFEIGPDINGSGSADFEWSRDSSLICFASQNGMAYILDKRGKRIKQTQIPKKPVISIDWDKDNETICILQQGNSFVTLWNWNTNSVTNFDTDNPKFKATFAKWSKTHPVLAVGTEKGTLIFQNKYAQKRVPTMGKHSKKIYGGSWSNQGQLITVSQQKILTVSGPTGETVCESFSLKTQPREVRWLTEKSDDRTGKQKSICAIINSNKSLLIYDINNKTKPSNELVFEGRYGKIVDYCSYGDGYMVIGFDGGWYNQISSHQKQMNVQFSSEKIFNGPIEALSVNENVFKLAAAGESKIKFINLSNNKENKNEAFEYNKMGRIIKMRWSQSGQYIVFLTNQGHLLGLLTVSLSNFATYNELLAVGTSVSEISIYSTLSKSGPLCTVEISNEAQGLAIGPRHIAVQNSNALQFYTWLTDTNKTIKQGKFQNQKQYAGMIKRTLLNGSHAVVMTDNRTYLHPIEGKIEGKQIKFPKENEKPVIGVNLTKDFLIYLDASGKIKYYSIQDDTQVLSIESKSESNLNKIFANRLGTRIVGVDSKGAGYLIEPTSQTFTIIPQFPQKCEKVSWDLKENNQFTVVSADKYVTFVVSPHNIFGKKVQPVKEILDVAKALVEDGTVNSTPIQKSNKLICISDGQIFSLTPQATIIINPLNTHSYLKAYKEENDNEQGHVRYFLQNLCLKRFKNALVASQHLKEHQVFQILGKKAIENVQLELALMAFQAIDNISMVFSLQSVLTCSDKMLLYGHCAMVLSKYDVAQEYYLKSSQPHQALEMRCDVQDWVLALNLAKDIAPEQQVYISRRLAAQLQAQGNISQALKLNEKSIITDFSKYDSRTAQDHNTACKTAAAKCCFKLSEVQRGYNFAREVKDPVLLAEIAATCQNTKNFMQAADLYQKAGVYDKSASLYLQLKMYDRATPLMQKVNSSKILVLFGKAKQSERNFKQAEAAYEKAQAWEEVVRINLNCMDNLQKPKEVIKNKCSTITIASMVATYCVKRGLNKEAVLYLLLANKKEEAFLIAQSHDEMEIYADNLKDCSNEQRISIGQVFEGKSKWAKAASQYQLAQDKVKAIKLYQRAGQQYIQNMIQMVCKDKSNETLTQMVLDYLMGDLDGKPKDALWTYKLYKNVGNFKAAARIAITIANQDQSQAKYKKAHSLLFQTWQDIKRANINIPIQLQKKLMILHSYIIVVKFLIKLELHEDAAFLLHRVCTNIVQFPKNTVQILTTAVVEAHRSNFKAMAYQWSVVLMRTELRDQIQEKYKGRIQNIARKPVAAQQKEKFSPCPFCAQPTLQYKTECDKCQNKIPFCIASGKHVVKDELTFCPKCNFPAIHSYLKRILDADQECPMCSVSCTSAQLKLAGQAGVSKLRMIAQKKE